MSTNQAFSDFLGEIEDFIVGKWIVKMHGAFWWAP